MGIAMYTSRFDTPEQLQFLADHEFPLNIKLNPFKVLCEYFNRHLHPNGPEVSPFKLAFLLALGPTKQLVGNALKLPEIKAPHCQFYKETLEAYLKDPDNTVKELGTKLGFKMT